MLYICCKSFLQRVHKDALSAMTWRHWRSQRLFLMLLTRSSTQKSSYLCASPFPRADARNFTFFPPRFPSSHKNPSPKSLLTSLLGDGTVNSCGMQPAAPVLNNRIHWLTRQTWVVFFLREQRSPLLPNLLCHTSSRTQHPHCSSVVPSARGPPGVFQRLPRVP